MHKAIVGFIFEQKRPARDALEVMFMEVEGNSIGRVGYVKITDDDIDFCGTPDEYQALKAQGLKIDV